MGNCIAYGCYEKEWAGKLCRAHHPRHDFNEQLATITAERDALREEVEGLKNVKRKLSILHHEAATEVDNERIVSNRYRAALEREKHFAEILLKHTHPYDRHTAREIARGIVRRIEEALGDDG